METQHTVKARVRRRCDDGGYGCWGWIEPGMDYLRAVAFPGSDLINEEGTRPRVMNVCGGCTTLVGHAPRMRRRRRFTNVADSRFTNDGANS